MLLQQPHCCHSSCNAPIALSPQQPRCRHSSHIATAIAPLPQHLWSCRRVVATAAALPWYSTCGAAIALSPQQPRCRGHIVTTAAHRRAATAHRCRRVPQLPHRQHCVVDTAAMMLPSRCCCSSRVVATAGATLPSRCHHSSCVVATAAATTAAVLLPQPLRCCRCVVATAARRCHSALPPSRATAATLPPLHCCHSSRDAVVALLPQRHSHSSVVAIALLPLLPTLLC